MTQASFRADSIQVEPGAVGTRLISRSTAGDLLFTDPSNPSGIALTSLAGLRSITSVLMVGQSGPGAQYTTIQDALDAVLSTSSLTSPTLILVAPGVYQEDLIIEKDGVWLVGLGGVILTPATATATITVRQSVTSTPKWLRLQNLRILNANAGEECLLLQGGANSEVGLQEIGICDCELVASGVGAYQMLADTVNIVRVQGGTFENSSATSSVRVTNCHQVTLTGVQTVLHLQMDYSTTLSIPYQTGSEYLVKGVTLQGNVLSTLTGAGALYLDSVLATSNGNLTVAGNRACHASSCKLGNITVNNTAALVLASCERGTITGAGTIAENIQEGSVSFVGVSSSAVVFAVKHPDAVYTVHPETELLLPISVTAKTSTGFTLAFTGVQTTTVNYKVLRRL
jgi:hypothetical protein